MCATNTRYGAMIRTSGIQLLRAMHRASRVLVVLACVWATVALAVPPEQVASSLARRALQLDEAGDPVQAAALYLEAFRTDSLPCWTSRYARRKRHADRRIAWRLCFCRRV